MARTCAGSRVRETSRSSWAVADSNLGYAAFFDSDSTSKATRSDTSNNRNDAWRHMVLNLVAEAIRQPPFQPEMSVILRVPTV
jgi:hypothetical protein